MTFMDKYYRDKRTEQNEGKMYDFDEKHNSSPCPEICPMLGRRSFPSLSDILKQEEIKKEALELLRDTMIALKEMREAALADQRRF